MNIFNLINMYNLSTSEIDIEIVGELNILNLNYGRNTWYFLNLVRDNRLTGLITVDFNDSNVSVCIKESSIEKLMEMKDITATSMIDEKTLDIKVGYSCNNNCIHCVVKPNIMELRRQGSDIKIDPEKGIVCKDPKTSELLKLLIKEISTGKYYRIVWTGGEPLIREDFIEVMLFIKTMYPHLKHTIQTNGRALADISLVKKLWSIDIDIEFVVAIHGEETDHNRIVNNRKEKGNPYQETVIGIENLQRIFNKDLRMRTEIVLSTFNINSCFQSVVKQYMQLGVKRIGISYPHFEGYSKMFIEKVCPSLSEVKELLENIDKFIKEVGKNDLTVEVEEVPRCIYRDIRDCSILDMSSHGDVDIFYLLDKGTDFTKYLNDVHIKNQSCKKCVFSASCRGIWVESFEFNRKHLKPIIQGDIK